MMSNNFYIHYYIFFLSGIKTYTLLSKYVTISNNLRSWEIMDLIAWRSLTLSLKYFSFFDFVFCSIFFYFGVSHYCFHAALILIALEVAFYIFLSFILSEGEVLSDVFSCRIFFGNWCLEFVNCSYFTRFFFFQA